MYTITIRINTIYSPFWLSHATNAQQLFFHAPPSKSRKRGITERCYRGVTERGITERCYEDRQRLDGEWPRVNA